MRKTTAALLTASALVLAPTAAQAQTLVPAVAVSAASTADEDVAETVDDAEDGFDWGLLGLLGLAGLAGLAGRNKREVHADHTTRRDVDVDRTRATGTTAAGTTAHPGTTSPTDVNRDGRTDHRDVRDGLDRDNDGRIG